MACICIYCAASPGTEPLFLEAARQTGQLIAQQGHQLVYGGGNSGLMGAVANAALEAGGQVIGVIPEQLAKLELAHTQLSELIMVDSMHQRKKAMADRADAFIALPGGVGTLEEIIEVFVWNQLNIHQKSCGLLNIQNFYDPLIALMQGMTSAGFLQEAHLTQWQIKAQPQELIEAVLNFTPTYVTKIPR